MITRQKKFEPLAESGTRNLVKHDGMKPFPRPVLISKIHLFSCTFSQPKEVGGSVKREPEAPDDENTTKKKGAQSTHRETNKRPWMRQSENQQGISDFSWKFRSQELLHRKIVFPYSGTPTDLRWNLSQQKRARVSAGWIHNGLNWAESNIKLKKKTHLQREGFKRMDANCNNWRKKHNLCREVLGRKRSTMNAYHTRRNLFEVEVELQPCILVRGPLLTFWLLSEGEIQLRKLIIWSPILKAGPVEAWILIECLSSDHCTARASVQGDADLEWTKLCFQTFQNTLFMLFFQNWPVWNCWLLDDHRSAICAD